MGQFELVYNPLRLAYNANFALTSETIGGIYTRTINRTYTETGAKSYQKIQ